MSSVRLAAPALPLVRELGPGPAPERVFRALDLARKHIASGRTADNQPVDIHRARSAMSRAEARLECRLVRL